MNKETHPTRGQLRLDLEAYRKLCREVMKRDNWRCQNCGAQSNLQVHHKQFRSHQGSDDERNLITLCSECHRRLHTK